MMSIRALAVACLWPAAMTACGGDDGGGGGGPDAGLRDAASDDINDRLAVLPGVISVDEMPHELDGHRYFEIAFDQPVDHDNPDGQHFTQYLTLTHVDDHAPFILATTGYDNYYGEYPMEPTELLDGNQLIIEHRYFTPSRPDPTNWDHLRVRQSAADHHAIAQSFRYIYDGPWISTGGSKGGMTSIYHRYLYPDDVDGTVAYVAPYNQDLGDTRYDAWFDEVLPGDCLQRVRDAQVEFLTNRRQALGMRAAEEAETQDIRYTRVALPVAVESAVAGIEWSFFQYIGVGACEQVPGPEATDDEVWEWMRDVSPPDSLSDAGIARFEPYYFQVEAELGSPSTTDEHLEGLLAFGAEDYAGAEPEARPDAYDPSVVDAAAGWVKNEAAAVILLYGEYDPWTAGAFDAEGNAGVGSYTVVGGTHSSSLLDLPEGVRTEVFDTIEAWTGVKPALPSLRARWFRVRAPEPRPPLRGWAMARRARLDARR